MSKYTKEQKLHYIDLHKQGLSLREIEAKYNVHRNSVLRWIQQFNIHGAEGLTSYGKPLQHFSLSFKLEVIQWLVSTQSSYPKTAHHFNLPSPSVIWTWKQRYDELGIDGLSDPRNLKVKMMSEKQLTPEEEVKQLRERIAYVEAENAYLKKLDAVMKKKRMKKK